MGYDWIGWKRRSSLDFIFHFSTIENFTSIRIHTSNLFTRDIYLFNSIFVTNCRNDLQTTFLLIPEDSKDIQARFVNISLAFGHGIISDCLKLTLTFNNRSKWILISEILFQSKPIISHPPTLPTRHIDSSTTLIGTGIFQREKLRMFLFCRYGNYSCSILVLVIIGIGIIDPSYHSVDIHLHSMDQNFSTTS